MNKLLILLLVLWGTPAWAQPEGEEQPAVEEAETEPEPAATRPATDPFDYESSEQISEDLSVSFPVDI
ncbi:MAG: hypothetical protein V7720_11980 [Halioglobus sp.]